jgi:ATP-dependent helicase HrpB
LIVSQSVAEWDAASEKMLFEGQRCCGQLVIQRKPFKDVSAEQVLAGMLAFIRKKGLDILPWQDTDRRFLQRLSFAKTHCPEVADWPSADPQSLLDKVDVWLSPFLVGVQSLKQLQKIDLSKAIYSLPDWSTLQQLNSCCPDAVLVPTGRYVDIDYSGERPVLAVKMQEMFGCPATPTIAMGKVSLTVHLLSPAQRPLAVTADLASFWKNAYQEVKKDMKGRYPKHYWPDDPLQAMPTKHVKSRM